MSNITCASEDYIRGYWRAFLQIKQILDDSDSPFNEIKWIVESTLKIKQQLDSLYEYK
jgi:hypothetical protein